MRLARLEIQTLPGIDPGFTLEGLVPTINMVTGPNGVGKSSILRALRYLIAPPTDTDPTALSLSAVLEDEDHRWTVRRTGRQVAWERDGQAAELPALPDSDQLHCYWLSMEDLLQADERDEQLVAELRRALAGGYDLPAVREIAPFVMGPRVGQVEARRLQSARKELRRVESHYEELRRQETDIPELDSKIRAAREAAPRANKLRAALDLLEAGRERKGVEARNLTFPANMARLRGDELERLERLDKRRESLQSAIESARHQRTLASETLAKTGLPDDRLASAVLEARRTELERARRKTDQHEQIQQQRRMAQVAEQQAMGALGGKHDKPKLDPQNVSRAEKLAMDLQEKERQRREVAAQADGPSSFDRADLERHRRATDALTGWLVTVDRVPWHLWTAISVAGFGGLVALVAAFLAAEWVALGGAGVSLVSCLWAWLVSRADGTVKARCQFEEIGLEAPAAWHEDEVAARRSDIENRQLELEQQFVLTQHAGQAQRRLRQLDSELDELQNEKQELASELGFDPALSAVALDRFVRLVGDYEKAMADRKVADANIRQLSAEIDALAGKVREFLAAWGAGKEELEGLDDLEAGLESLRTRCRDAEAAERDLAETERTRKRLMASCDEVDEEIEGLFKSAGLEPGQRTELTQCCNTLEKWRELQEEMHGAQQREVERRSRLEGDNELLGRVEADEEKVLLREHQQAEDEAAELEDLHTRLTEIRTRLRDAGRDQRLENVRAKVDSNLATLTDRRDEALFAESAQYLLDSVEMEFRVEHEPEVLRDARERFKRFTHHTHELELDEQEGFAARDVQQQARRSLRELSSGTRIQLLLAVRLAWTRRLEQGRLGLPLFLDEALTTSDEARFAHVVSSLEQLAQDEGRQIFYLSARRHEVALWEQATGNRPFHIDLAAVRFGPLEADIDFSIPEIEKLPTPVNDDAEGYAAALNVQPIDTWRPEGAIHLFHLLRDDLTLLHHLMEHWRISTLGQLESLLGSTASDAAIDGAELRERLLGRCVGARAWVTAWRQGRGRPVEESSLRSSEIMSDAFINAVTELAEKLEGNGAALIKALREGEVSRFRQKNTEELEQWLKENGFVDSAPRLDKQERERRVLLDAGAFAGTSPDEMQTVVRWLEAGITRNCSDG